MNEKIIDILRIMLVIAADKLAKFSWQANLHWMYFFLIARMSSLVLGQEQNYMVVNVSWFRRDKIRRELEQCWYFYTSLQPNMVFMSSPFTARDLPSNTEGLLHYDELMIKHWSLKILPGCSTRLNASLF